MPLYEYKCDSCGKTFEVIQKFSDEPLTVHSECGGKVERLISAPAFHLKGTGWYATDYAKSNGSDSKSRESKDGKSDESTSAKSGDSESKTESTKKSDTPSSSGDSKPAASADTKPSATPTSNPA